MHCADYEILSQTGIGPGLFDLRLCAPEIACEAAPGQFVDVLCAGKTLRRPISLCGFDARTGEVRLVYEVRGEGTAWLARRGAGETLNVLGPLGHGFDLSPAADPEALAVFVGGGVGTPPLLAAAAAFGARAAVILGFRTAAAAMLVGDFEALGAAVSLATDDGTAGHHGLVTAPLQKRLDEAPCAIVYACGPKPMLSAVARIARERGIRCQLSMEERMACGVGACLCCAVKTRDPDGGEHMRHVCKHGPVFEAEMLEL